MRHVLREFSGDLSDNRAHKGRLHRSSSAVSAFRDVFLTTVDQHVITSSGKYSLDYVTCEAASTSLSTAVFYHIYIYILLELCALLFLTIILDLVILSEIWLLLHRFVLLNRLFQKVPLYSNSSCLQSPSILRTAVQILYYSAPQVPS